MGVLQPSLKPDVIPAIKKFVRSLSGYAHKWLHHWSGTSGVLILVASSGTFMLLGSPLMCDSHLEIHVE